VRRRAGRGTDPGRGHRAGPGLGDRLDHGRPAAAVGALLGVPEGIRARILVSLGYPTEEGSRPKSAPGTARRPLAEMVRFERFS
ncbi:MAG: hypothetical protein ACXWMX_02965, partial [Candidatus Limnocylindrales bacterium]